MASKGRPQPPMGLLRRLDSGARASFPVLSTIALMVVAMVPIGVPGLVAAAALPGVFFWTIFRPAAFPPPAVFLVGLLQDLLTFAPLGTGVLSLLALHGLALRGRLWLMRQSFLSVWLVFCAFAAGAAGLGWLLHAVLAWQAPPYQPALHQLGLSAGIYPLLSWATSLMHHAMSRAEEAA
jgi:rod shape-determining protein MreD